MEQITSKKSFKVRYLLGILIIAVAAYAIVTSGAPRYTIPLAEDKLSLLAEHYAKMAKVGGQDARMHYNSLGLQGFGQNKEAVIARWSMDLLRQSWLSVERLTLSSENVHMVPNHVLPNSTLLRIGQIINVITGSELRYTATPSQSLYILHQTTGDKNEVDILQELWMAKNSTLNLKDRLLDYSFTFSDSLRAELRLPPPHNQLNVSVHFGPFTVEKGAETWHIANGSFQTTMIKKTPRVVESKGTASIDGISLSALPQIDPAHFNMAWMYKEMLSLNGVVESSELEIERSMLTNDKVKVAASGNLYFSVEDQTPYGEIALEISDIKLLVESEWLLPAQRKRFELALESMIGQQIEERTQEIITLQRDPDGEWKCGKITCKALLEQGIL